MDIVNPLVLLTTWQVSQETEHYQHMEKQGQIRSM
jgi:hypothetical protein